MDGLGAVTHSELGSTDPIHEWLVKNPLVPNERCSHYDTMSEVVDQGERWPIVIVTGSVGKAENAEDPERLAPFIVPATHS